ncbi:MAG: hypothetical protein ACKVOJ_08535 [Sphingomonadaceae bacterium]
MSSKLLLFICLLPINAQAQDGVSAEAALAKYKALTSDVIGTCDRATAPDEITVCGRERSKYALPFPLAAEDRDRPRRATGEIPSAVPSSPPCPPRGCPGGGKLFDTLGKFLGAVLDPEE